jgi:hypothetical protein
MVAPLQDNERLQDLLATRAVEGLSQTEQDELIELVASHPGTDPEELERVAASLAMVGLRTEPMPASLRTRVAADAAVWFARREARPANGDAPAAATVTELRRQPPPSIAWGGWFAAAAALVLAVIGWVQVDRMEHSLAEREATLAELREPAPAELLAALQARPDTVIVPWSATDDPAAGGAEGAVIWNSTEQAGLMRIRGLQANDPAVAQYQLWIFDAARDDRFPVDGGVFDIPRDAEEVLVPIRARLPVGEAALFAITVEAPGGVVVSSRERIALVAQPEA